MQSVQKFNQENIKNLKEWQAEAFIYVLLYCCLKFPTGNIMQVDLTYRKEWSLSKICILNEQIGNIFEWQFTDKIIQKIIGNDGFIMPPVHDFITGQNARSKYQHYLSSHEALITNLRLLPKESHQELLNICSVVLDGGGKEDGKLKAVITKELI